MNQASAPIQHRFFHDSHLWWLLMVFFVTVALNPPWYLVGLWSMVFWCVALLQKVPFTFTFKALMGALVLSLSVWLLNILYPSSYLSHEAAMLNAQQTALKIWALTWVALMSSKMIHPHNIVVYAIQKKWLNLILGYATLTGLSSIHLLRAEMRRISLNAKLRQFSFKQRFLQWIPLLVFALKHAQRGAMSLRARGILVHKSFYYDYSARRPQIIRALILVAVFALTTGLVLFTISVQNQVDFVIK